LGYASPARMMQEMTAKEYQEWKQLWNEDPWGDDRADWRVGQLSRLTAQAHFFDGKPGSVPFQIKDFIYSTLVCAGIEEEKPQQTVAEQQQLAKTLAAVMKGQAPGGSDRTA
jgi:hypothetical protein